MIDTLRGTPQRCEVRNDQLLPCATLFKALEDGPPLRLLTIFSLGNGELTRRFVTLFSGAFERQGIVLNFCPFCGACLLSDVETTTTRLELSGTRVLYVQHKGGTVTGGALEMCLSDRG